MKVMNTSNPFQIPVCLQRADYQQRRRERFKKGFIAAVAAAVVLLVGLLIEGCMSEKTAAPPAGAKLSDLTFPQSTDVAVTAPRPVSHPQADASNPHPTVAATAAVATPAPAAQPARIRATYVVKAGDTLTRIARAQGTTVKAIKAANNLDNDRIVVGAHLKIPETGTDRLATALRQ